MKSALLIASVFIALVVTGFGVAITWGGPDEVPPMPSINDPFKSVDYSDLPKPSYFSARDKTQLTYRAYSAGIVPVKGSVVLVHGSSASGISMHVMAKGMAAVGYNIYALDIRGHGESGTKGQIAYVGQLEDDIEDFTHAVKLAQPSTLTGFSAGGGFVLRVAGSERQKQFSNYLLLSPFISQEAATYRPHSGGWANVGIPRFIAIAILEKLGIKAFNHLIVTKFALNDEAKKFLTPEYSYALAQNFRPERDYNATIRAVQQPVKLIAGQDDEAFFAEQFANVFKAAGKNISITLLPKIGHIQLTIDPKAVQAAVDGLNFIGQ